MHYTIFRFFLLVKIGKTNCHFALPTNYVLLCVKLPLTFSIKHIKAVKLHYQNLNVA